jgi:hypothetical protein
VEGTCAVRTPRSFAVEIPGSARGKDGEKCCPTLVKENHPADRIGGSREAHIGSLARASLERESIQAIEKAGFDHIRIIDETHIPVELAVNGPAVPTIMEKPNQASENLRGLARTVVSIGIQALKPEAI